MIGNKLKMLRLKRGLKQGELAKLLGLSASAVGMYEQNRREPDYKTLLMYADIFGVSVDYIISENDEESHELVPEIRKFMLSQDALMFNGKQLSDKDIEQIMQAIEITTTLLKEKKD